MKTHTWLALATSCFCAILTHCAWAQQALNIAEATYQRPSKLALETGPYYAGDSEEYRYYDHHQWIANLQKAGIFNRFLPRPYRVAMPLMSFGDAGPKVMLTYTKNMPGNDGARGLLLFMTIEIP